MEHVDKLRLRDMPSGVVIAVKAVPGASRDKIVGVLGDRLKIATAQPAEKGQANTAIGQVLAKALGLHPGAVILVAGASRPHKEFRIEGRTAVGVRARLRELA
ncbi:MAG: DUF167 domain-containing protein [Phycisphaerae bacterium]|jgi:uncharacterized protein (TIGR00251 family)